MLLLAPAHNVANMVGYKKRKSIRKKEPHWKRTIVEKQNKLRKDLGQINRLKRNKPKSEDAKKSLKGKLERT